MTCLLKQYGLNWALLTIPHIYTTTLTLTLPPPISLSLSFSLRPRHLPSLSAAASASPLSSAPLHPLPNAMRRLRVSGMVTRREAQEGRSGEEQGGGGWIQRAKATASGLAAAMCSSIIGNMLRRRALDGLSGPSRVFY